MRNYSADKYKCVKCGHNVATTRYQRIDFVLGLPERLERICCNCEHVTFEMPLDHE